MDKKHIYIVDDSKTILKHAEGVLIGSYKISLFQSGQTALEQMHRDIPRSEERRVGKECRV